MSKEVLKIYKLMFIVFCSFSIFQGCGYIKGTIKFDSLRYPVSLSPYIYDSNDNIIEVGKDLKRVNSFSFDKTSWTIFYGLIPLSNDRVISEKINSIVEKNQGDGIVNLSIDIEHGTLAKFYAFLYYIPCYIPLVPYNAKITINGDVVKLASDNVNPEK